MHQQDMCLLLLKVEQSAFTQAFLQAFLAFMSAWVASKVNNREFNKINITGAAYTDSEICGIIWRATNGSGIPVFSKLSKMVGNPASYPVYSIYNGFSYRFVEKHVQAAPIIIEIYISKLYF